MKKDRLIYLDLLRIIACFMVIIIHVVVQYWYVLSPADFNWKVLNFYDCFARSSVPIFFMISGFCFLSKEELSVKVLLKKNILHLFVGYIIWFLIYLFAEMKPIHLWFIPTMISIYFLMPIIYSFVKFEDGKYIKYFLILFLLFGIVKNTVLSLENLPQLLKAWIEFIPMELCEYVGYFVLGYWLASKEFKIHKRVFLFFYIIAVIITTFLSQKISIMNGNPSDQFYSFLSIFTFIEACCLFLYVKSFAINSKRLNTTIRIFSDCSFGIYLMHIFVLNFITEHFGIDAASFNPMVWVPIFSFFILLIHMFFSTKRLYNGTIMVLFLWFTIF